MQKLLKWLDNNILKLALVAYIFFIPLFPKLPFRMVNYTYIAVRFEDLFAAILYLIFFVQIVRKKVSLHSRYLLLFCLFWVAVFVSFVMGWFVQKTIIIQHLGLLHALRRIEYMGVFFVFVASVKSRKDFMFYFRLILLTLGIVAIYGLGQKYAGWPAVQTMNPEYSKGYILILDSWARISSTFGGHYDLAAYLIFFMPVILALTIQISPWFYALFLLALSNLVLTASRVSYGAYLMSAFPFLFTKRKWMLMIVTIVATAGMTLLSNNLTQRLNRTFQTKQIFIDKTTGQTTVPRRLKPDDLPVGDYIIGKQAATDNAIDVGDAVLNKKDEEEAKLNLRDQIREDAAKTGKKLTKEEEDQLVEEAFSKMRVVSAVIPDISVATRLQVEWPRAIKAFLKYPVFGKGPSTITEATDNDYLRWLGEFGIVGTSLFLVILGSLFMQIWKASFSTSPDAILFWGILAGFGGLLVNATYIDIFEASKMAFIFWSFMGMTIGYIEGVPAMPIGKKPPKSKIKTKTR
jgi:hypothetical protein